MSSDQRRDISDAPSDQQLRRGLRDRHIQLIALGGAIGSGLFYGSADSVGTAGPAVILSYLVGGFIIYFIMRALGEMSVYRPSSGAFSEYAHTWWGDLPGFISGWNYWFNYIFVSMAELTVVGIYVNYWFPDVPRWVTAAAVLILITAVNLAHVRAYGEFEFWFAIIKVVAVIAMIILGIWVMVVGTTTTPATGIANIWADGGFFPKGAGGMLAGIIVVMFSFGGTELIGITAGEAEEPKKSIPRAINRVVSRILIFYVGALVVTLAIVPWTTITGDSSPFVQIFDTVGIPGAASILNLVVLTAAISAYNSGLYANGRMLHALARQGNAPRILATVNKAGVPWVGVLVSSAITAIAVIIVGLLPAEAFGYVMSIAMIAAVINWTMITITQMLFRRRLSDADRASLTFRMPLWPVFNWVVLAFMVLMVGVMIALPPYRIAAAAGPVWLAVLTLGWWLSRRRRPVREHADAEPVAHP